MERRDHEERYQAWREAEARGDERTADAALAALFEALPLEAPSEGFAAATLDRVRARGRAEAAAPSSHATRWAAAVLGLLSAGTLGLSILAIKLLPLLELGGAVATFNVVLGAIGEWIASGIALWGQAAEWSAVLARIVTVPGVAGALVLAAATAAFALTLLRRILLHDPHEKEPSHV